MKHLEKCQTSAIETLRTFSDSHKFTMGCDETLRKMSDSHKFTMGSDETLRKMSDFGD